jgi:hypothetical protein
MTTSAFQMSLMEGERLFEAHEYFAAHEAFEAGWRVTRGDEKRVLQVLVLWVASIFQHEKGRGGGARRLLGRALERLGTVDDGFEGIDVDALKGCLIDTWGQIVAQEALTPKWPAAFPASAVRVQLDHRSVCPYCAEPVLVSLEVEDVDGASFVEDCPVCCRSWSVLVRRDGLDTSVAVRRLDA